MSFDLGSLLQSQLGNVLSQFLSQNGEPAEGSAKAAGLAIPAVVAGLVKHVSGDTQNAAGLFDLLSGASGNALNGALSQATSGTDLGSLIDLGKSLLPNLLGGSAANVSDEIARESGISKVSGGSLMALALPLVLSFLRGHVKDNNLNQSQVLGLLAGQQGWLSQALNSNILTALGIGSISGLFGTLTNMAAGFAAGTPVAAAAGKSGGAGKWIALAVVAALAAFAVKSCNSKPDNAVPPAATTAAASEPVTAEASAPAAAVADSARVVYENGVAKFFFATGKTDVAEGAETIVADITAAGKEGKKLVVSGYADSTGNAAANEELSKNRAQAVKAFFEAQGVAADNIELRKPEDTTGAVGNDVEGRRVEVKVEG